VISYAELLNIFWENHDPTIQSWSRQYRNMILYHSGGQRVMAEESKERLASEMKREIVTDIIPISQFYPAEDYHQKYMLRNYPALMKEFEMLYPDVKKLVASTAAARVNGYLGGNGTCDQLKSEIRGLGLSESGSALLMREVCGRKAETFCPAGGCGF
jgi:peptide-methionine (S)-S-oxide reductase